MDSDLVSQLAIAFKGAFSELLSTKHIYQSVKLDTSFMQQAAAGMFKRGAVMSIDHGGEYALEHISMAWYPSDVRGLVETREAFNHKAGSDIGKFSLPIVKISCAGICDRVEPFDATGAVVEKDEKTDRQWYHLRYLCQGCREYEVRFLVRREMDKLTLSGRDPFQEVEVPKVIPKAHAKRFRDALVASYGGQPLAANFLLRVFVEQYWKSVPKVAKAIEGRSRPTGDEMGEAYKATLPDDFKSRFPTLAEVYSALSADMHEAIGSPELFSESVETIEAHFDARRLFKL